MNLHPLNQIVVWLIIFMQFNGGNEPLPARLAEEIIVQTCNKFCVIDDKFLCWV